MATEKTTKGRLAFVDNLRILLTILVILHHLVSSYGGQGSWYYKEGRLDGVSFIVVTLFMVVNQSFFMGFFYLIAGYFTPGSYDRKGAGSFLLNRLLRLGIPLLVYSILISPLIDYAIHVGVWGINRSFWKIWGWGGFFWAYAGRYLKDQRGIAVGPLWFVEALLIFSIAYALWRLVARPAANLVQRDHKAPSNLAIALFALGLGLVTFLVRVRLPVGWVFEPLGLQFPYFPQYIGAFVIGIVAFRRNWFLGISDAQGRQWQILAIFLIGLSAVVFAVVGKAIDPFRGGLGWQAVFLAFWEQLLGVAMMVGLLVLFRSRFDHQGKLAKAMAASSYAAFILHGPVLVLLAVRFSRVRRPPLLKFALLAPVAVFFCFSIGYLIRKLPLANRIL